MNVVSFTDFEISLVKLCSEKVCKKPKKMKSSDRFRTVFDAVVCQLFQGPYVH